MSRMANNSKGSSEMKGFKALGIIPKYNGNDMEEGIRLYESSEIDGRRVKQYGLEESGHDLWRGDTKVAGKKLLMIRPAALQHMFGDVSISGYSSLWRVGGAVDKKAQQADRTARALAVTHFRDSLKVRQGQGGDGGHQHMIEEMKHCMKRVEDMTRVEDKVHCTLQSPCSLCMFIYM